jgi:hypothetical protein
MPTFMQVVERLRERGLAPDSGPVCLSSLCHALGLPNCCMRSMFAAALAPIAVKRPWAVILCHYQDQQYDPTIDAPIEDFYRRAFNPGTGGLVEYYRDASLGIIDITGSAVFGWVKLSITAAQAGQGTTTNPGPHRADTVNYAIAAAKAAGLDPVTGFFNQIAIINRNWTQDSLEVSLKGQSPNWQAGDPLTPYYPFWIDGSEDPKTGKITLTPPHNGDVTAHEMGHALGMAHDIGSDLRTDYADPACIMSQNGAGPRPGWPPDQVFGPAICLPHLVLQNWMFKRRLFTTDSSWMNSSAGITIPLAALIDPGAQANLGARLTYNANGNQWNYYIEYMRNSFWDTGVPGAPFVIVRRTANIPGRGLDPVYLRAVPVPTDPNTIAHYDEPQGGVQFDVQWLGPTDRILKVTAHYLLAP